MPLSLVERLPLPSLRNYVIFSLTLIIFTATFALTHAKDFTPTLYNITEELTDEELSQIYDSLPFSAYIWCVWLASTSQAWTVWALINMSYCTLLLIGKGVQVVAFGNLRVSEVQQLKERFWNFAFYKFIFIFGVLNVQLMNTVMMWTAWFSVLCGLQLLAQLSKHRFEYLSCSPATTRSQHIKMIFLLSLVLLISFCLVASAIVVGLYTDWHTFGFMVAECLLLVIRTTYVIIKYAIYLVDVNHEGLWETRGALSYYTDLITDILLLLVELTHNLHMLIWSNIIFSMASIVVLMQIRHLIAELQKRYYKHRGYADVVKSMEARFSEATDDEIRAYDDNCAICWDKMQKARKLPCGHLFHNSCLRSWLAQDVSCPTCRVSLRDQKPEEVVEVDNSIPTSDHHVHPVDDPPIGEMAQNSSVNRTNHSFHFDGSRYVSWLPSFSVEVRHTQLNRPTRISHELEAMAREVKTIFPGMPLHSIIDDLRLTNSVAITIENILEGRLLLEPNSQNQPVVQPADSSDDDEEIPSLNIFNRDEQTRIGAASAGGSHSSVDVRRRVMNGSQDHRN